LFIIKKSTRHIVSPSRFCINDILHDTKYKVNTFINKGVVRGRQPQLL